MTEKFGVADRLILLATLPREGDILTLKIVRSLREQLELSEFELTALSIIQKDDQITWDNTKEVPKEIELSPKAYEIIAESFRQMNQRKLLRMEHIPLYERFVEAPNA